MGYRKYPTAAQVRKTAESQGPHAAAAAEAGGHLIQVPELKIKPVGRGCGSPTPVVGTSGTAPCGVMVTDLSGNREEHLCPLCGA